jgi:DNA-binding NtrC family response regulator
VCRETAMSEADTDLLNNLRRIDILLIDGDKWIRDSVTMFFEREGCRLSAFETAEEGLERLKNHDYQLVIAEYLLPGMDGLEFFRRVGQAHPQTLRLLTTSCGKERMAHAAAHIGIKELIEKPYSITTLKQSLRRVIGNDVA